MPLLYVWVERFLRLPVCLHGVHRNFNLSYLYPVRLLLLWETAGVFLCSRGNCHVIGVLLFRIFSLWTLHPQRLIAAMKVQYKKQAYIFSARTITLHVNGFSVCKTRWISAQLYFRCTRFLAESALLVSSYETTNLDRTNNFIRYFFTHSLWPVPVAMCSYHPHKSGDWSVSESHNVVGWIH